MEFKTRISNTFVMNIFMIVLALCMAAFCFLHKSFKYEILNYSYILWLFIALVRLANYKKYIYLLLSNKPVLIVNEDYIYDLADDVKFYWQDIDEIYEENAFLYIKLYKPNEYLDKIGFGKKVRNEIVSNPYKTPFIINIDLVNVNSLVLLEMLDNYSIQATANEKI